LQRQPVDKRSGYSKQIVWMDQEYLNPNKIEYYDRKGELLKTALFKDYKKFGDLLMASKVLQKVQGITIEVTIDTVVFDKVEPKIFELPKEIRALLPEDGEQDR